MSYDPGMATPRAVQVSVEATPYYHCISRCVRRAHLCGADRVTRRRFDHRKAWLVERMRDLGAVFAIDICAYAVMSNHYHLVVRIARERAEAWSDEEVVARYRCCFPGCVRAWEGMPAAEQKRRVDSWRQRLWNLSWFMRSLNEAIARRANREDDCTGRFWEGRFRSQALLDPGALLTCMSYVDLNPIRAGISRSLEQSDLTSIQQRLFAAASAHEVESSKPSLVPFAPEPEAAPTVGAFLPMTLSSYAELLRSLAAHVDDRSSAPVPAAARGALRDLGLDPDAFAANVRNFRRSFFLMVGTTHEIDVECRRRGLRRRRGLPGARRLYLPTAA